jgi:arylsulfatase A-like enzyme
VRLIYAMIRRMDAGVARVLEALERAGVADDTLVFFSSDNGPQFGGANEMCTDRFNCGFAGAKLLVYEGGIRLPIALRWPAGIAGGGRTLDGLAHFTDWLPTLLAVAGVEPSRERALDGIDLLPLLRGERGRILDRRFWQWNRYEPRGECNAAMRDGRWKLVRPAIDALMQVSRRDLEMDVESKLDPTKYTDIRRDPLPERGSPASLPVAALRPRERSGRAERPGGERARTSPEDGSRARRLVRGRGG